MTDLIIFEAKTAPIKWPQDYGAGMAYGVTHAIFCDIATPTKPPIKWVQIDDRLQARNRKARRAAQALKRKTPK